MAGKWSPESWRGKPVQQSPDYPDPVKLEAVENRLRGYPPLVFAGETRRLMETLGEVAEGRRGYECVESGHGRDPHGPYLVDELLGAAGQRDGATCRARIARREQMRQRPRTQLPALPAIDPARLWRLVAAATVLAATVAFLSR